jgi:CBS domain-containing protein
MTWESLGWQMTALAGLWLGFAGAVVRGLLIALEGGHDAPEDYRVLSRLRRLQDDPAGLGLRLRFSRLLSAAVVPLGLAMGAKLWGGPGVLAGGVLGFLFSAAAENAGSTARLVPLASWRGGSGLGIWIRLTGPIARLAPSHSWDKTSAPDAKGLVLTESRASLLPTRLEREERILLRRLLASAAIIVSDIMTRWNKVVTVSADANRAEALKQIQESGHSRLPVVDKDSVVGLVMAKTMLTSSLNARVSSVQQACWFLRDDTIVQDALDEMRDARTHLAVVMDRLGRPVGLITIEDILEEIVGELYDEREAPQ